MRLSDVCQMYDVQKRERCDEQRLKRDADIRIEARVLLERAVGGERAGEVERDIRHLAELVCHIEDTAGRDGERYLFGTAERFFEDEYAERDADERVDIVAEARLDDISAVDCPDIRAPVARDEETAARHSEEAFFILPQRAEHICRLTQSAQYSKQNDHKDERPQYAVREDLVRACRLKHLPVDGQDTPDDVCAECGEEAAFVKRCGHTAHLF